MAAAWSQVGLGVVQVGTRLCVRTSASWKALMCESVKSSVELYPSKLMSDVADTYSFV